MNDYSFLIGGKAGFGIDKASTIIGRTLSELGFRIYIYRDYPSLIRGGHTFSIIRACENKVYSHTNHVDLILALNQDTLNLHAQRLDKDSIVIFDSDSVNVQSLPEDIRKVEIPITRIIKDEGAEEIMRNTCIIGALCKTLGISWEYLDKVFRREIAKALDINLKIARKGFDCSQELLKLKVINQKKLPLLSGNEALSLGLVKGGLEAYIAYPMTPASPILHFLAEKSGDFNLKVIHPESEIAVMLMALGFAYMGKKAAVGTSGGGFCLMTEGLSFSGMAELPVVVVLGQRPGPSTGLPTYSAQTELYFALYAGQGEFPRLVIAPGDAEESYFWSVLTLNLSWKYQIPGIILTDKDLGEGFYSFDYDSVGEIENNPAIMWDKKGSYKRYLSNDNGVSPLAFAPEKEAVIKVNSYEHDEFGITTEDPELTQKAQAKRLKKKESLSQELDKLKTVNVLGNETSSTGIICWGSNKGVCTEVARALNLKLVQPVVLSPFPLRQFQEALSGVNKLICVENNATGQLAELIKGLGFKVDEKILKYDGRPHAYEELETQIKKLI